MSTRALARVGLWAIGLFWLWALAHGVLAQASGGGVSDRWVGRLRATTPEAADLQVKTWQVALAQVTGVSIGQPFVGYFGQVVEGGAFNRKAVRLDHPLVYQLIVIEGLHAGDARWADIDKALAYREPYYEVAPLYQPNDPQADSATGGQRALLRRVEAYAGWAATRGDSTVVVGIIDTGTDWTLPDLGNVAFNRADPVNGIDDDGNGLVDDFAGYDFGDLDPDVRPTNPHGTNVASLSSATSENSLGIAGLAMNCRYLPVKIFGRRTRALEGVMYAASRGCRVINMSYGRVGFPTQYERDFYGYLRDSLGIVLVGAAGNTNAELDFYPASYEQVISVAYSDFNDVRHPSATHSTRVDVVAPGSVLFGISSQGTYVPIGGGSSFAAPVVSALAALAMTRYPNLSARQVAELIRVNADVIDTLAPNQAYAGRLGSGRVNYRRTLASPHRYSVRLSEPLVLSRAGQRGRGGDTLALTYDLTNVLDPMASSRVRWALAGTDTALAQVLDSGAVAFGLLGTGAMRAGLIVRLRSRVTQTGPVRVMLYADIRGVGPLGQAHHQRQYMRVWLNRPWVEVPSGQSLLTISDNARIGFADDRNESGLGHYWQGRNLLGEGGIILAQDSVRVPNSVVRVQGKDDDWRPLRETTLLEEPTLGRATAFGVTSDLAAGVRRIGLALRQRVTGLSVDSLAGCHVIDLEGRWAQAGARPRLLALGLYLNYDLTYPDQDRIDYDTTAGVALIYNLRDTGVWVGVAPVRVGLPLKVTAIDLVAGLPGNPDLTDGFSTIEKYRAIALVGGSRHRAGYLSPTGGDVALAIGQTVPPSGADSAYQVAYGVITGGSRQQVLAQMARLRHYFATTLRPAPVWGRVETTLTLCPDAAIQEHQALSGRWRHMRLNGPGAGALSPEPGQNSWRLDTLAQGRHQFVSADSVHVVASASFRVSRSALGLNVTAASDTLTLPFDSARARIGVTGTGVQVTSTLTDEMGNLLWTSSDTGLVRLQASLFSSGRYLLTVGAEDSLGCRVGAVQVFVVRTSGTGRVWGRAPNSVTYRLWPQPAGVGEALQLAGGQQGAYHLVNALGIVVQRWLITAEGARGGQVALPLGLHTPGAYRLIGPAGSAPVILMPR